MVAEPPGSRKYRGERWSEVAGGVDKTAQSLDGSDVPHSVSWADFLLTVLGTIDHNRSRQFKEPLEGMEK